MGETVPFVANVLVMPFFPKEKSYCSKGTISPSRKADVPKEPKTPTGF
jgi:hypothetical protein